ncbi:DUF7373 family lipoprotein [Nocardia crassostreae]|uniref:DUF7373 family lipoprotein n=1 Tax=Nocardia crassostreae TaxID=53428 RepID=UPI0012FCBD23|nr:hypothetical protein [Nocardia crassostreae]
MSKHRYEHTAGTDGALAEGIRMAEAVVLTSRIDFTLPVGYNAKVLLTPVEVEEFGMVAGASTSVLERHRMLVGYGTSGGNEPETEEGIPSTATIVSSALLRFPSAAAAATAAVELENTDFGVAADQNVTLHLAEYPAAYIHWRPGIANVGVYLAHDEFVLSLLIERPFAEEHDLLEWVRKTLDAQLPVLEKFRPTAESDLDDLPLDPEGLLARTVTRDRGVRVPEVNSFAVYGINDFVHRVGDQARWVSLFERTGTDAIAYMNDDLLLRARDPDAAHALADGFAALFRDNYSRIDGPSGAPDVKCTSVRNVANPENYWVNKCFVVYRRYVAVLNGDDRSDLLQRAAAQYALFANSF